MIRFEMNRKQEAILAAIILIGAIGVFILYTGIGSSPDPVPEPPPPPPEVVPPPEPVPTLLETINAHIDSHNNIYENLTTKLEENLYTLDNPLISINPYGTNPLAALILFQTEGPSRISFSIKGVEDCVSISHSISGYNTTHILEIFGLYPDTVNLVEITAENRNMREENHVQLLIPAGGIPQEFPTNLIHSRIERKTAELTPPLADGDDDNVAELPATEMTPPADGRPELTFTYSPLSAFDRNGDYRWLYSGFTSIYPVRYNDDGSISMILGSFDAGDALLISIDMLGRVFDVMPVDDEYQPDGHGQFYTQPGYLYKP